MHKALIGIGAFFSLIGTNALAADMVVKAAPVASAPVWTWTGFYVGGNIGDHWSDDGLSTRTSNPIGFFAAGAPAVIDTTSPTTFKPTGFIGGFEAGYNWQWGQYVAGIEGDFDWLTGSNSRLLTGFAAPVVAGDFEINSASTQYFATIRPRLGTVIFDPRLLAYITGGAAFARIRTTDAFSAGGGTNFQSIGVSQTRTGWTFGGGIEYAVTHNWSVKGEYLYADLGQSSAAAPSFTGAPGTFITYNHKYTENIARAGANYKF